MTKVHPPLKSIPLLLCVVAISKIRLCSIKKTMSINPEISNPTIFHCLQITKIDIGISSFGLDGSNDADPTVMVLEP